MEHSAKDLSHVIPRTPTPRPRNVVATLEEREKILSAAPPYVRCWLLLCSDLAIRSGTSARLTPANYDAVRRELNFTTKYNNRQRLPVTEELARLLDTCREPSLPFVAQLPRENAPTANRQRPMQALGHIGTAQLARAFRQLLKRCNITRSLRPHDFRRATAVRVYDATRDLRLVQAILGHTDLGSTLYYLDHNATPVPLSALELAKLPPATERPQ